MPKETLEITPSGGLYCPVRFEESRTIDCARPNGYAISDLLNQIRLNEEEEERGAFLTDGDILRWGLNILCSTPMGRAFAYDARFDGWMIAIEDGDEDSPGARLDSGLKCVTLSRYAEAPVVFSRTQPAQMQFLFNLLKALRLIWQDNTDLKRAEVLTAEAQMKRERLLQADADLCALLTAYQLRESGDHDFWRYILSSDLSAIAATLAECLDFDGSMDGILDALGFIFQDWFADDERLSRIDHATLTRMDRMPNFGVEAITFDDLIQLSILPEGFSYLEYSAAEVLTEAFYSRIPDETNRAHLLQITRESRESIIEDIGFRDSDLAEKIFPKSTFETVV